MVRRYHARLQSVRSGARFLRWRWRKASSSAGRRFARIKGEGVRRRLCSFTIDGFAPFHGGEAILFGGKVVGSTTSTGYGYTLGKTIAFGYLPVELAGEAAFEIEAFGKAYQATRGPRTLYDPKMERLKA